MRGWSLLLALIAVTAGQKRRGVQHIRGVLTNGSLPTSTTAFNPFLRRRKVVPYTGTGACPSPLAEIRSFFACVRRTMSVAEAGASNFDKTACFRQADCADPVCLSEVFKAALEDCVELPRHSWPELGPMALGTDSSRGRRLLRPICPSGDSFRAAMACIGARGGAPRYRGKDAMVGRCIFGAQRLNWACAQPMQDFFCQCIKSRREELRLGAARCGVRPDPALMSRLEAQVCSPVSLTLD